MGTDAAYPFLKEGDWNSDIYTKIPGASPSAVLKAVDKALVMGAAMDPAALKAGVLAHHKAIGSVDAKGVTSAADYEAINAAIGHMIASVPTSKTMDVYNAFSAIVPKDVPTYLMSTVKAEDAQKAYSALLEFRMSSRQLGEQTGSSFAVDAHMSLEWAHHSVAAMDDFVD